MGVGVVVVDVEILVAGVVEEVLVEADVVLLSEEADEVLDVEVDVVFVEELVFEAVLSLLILFILL